MAYCTNAHVRAICDTDITNAEIDDLIDECDDLLDLMVDMGSVSANVRRALSRTFTAIRCMLKDPNAQALGDYREDRVYALQKLNKELEWMIATAGGGMAFVYDYAEMRTLAG